MNAVNILNENEEGPLTEKSRRQFIRHLTDYQIQRFGVNIKTNEKESVAVAAGFVFRSLTPVSNRIIQIELILY